jgi:hypothetical protein
LGRLALDRRTTSDATESFATRTTSTAKEGFSETLLADRVMPERIVGAYRELERTVSDACRTGTRKHPKIRFVARRGAG